MGEHSNIEWTDHTFNPWIGCTKISPGCAHCYAATLDARRFSKTLGDATPAVPISHWGPTAPRHRTSATTWLAPLRWQRKYRKALAEGSPARPRVFCASLADWLDDEVPKRWRHDLLDLIDTTPDLEWLLLTKRPEGWRARMEECALAGSALAQRWLDRAVPKNITFGVTVEDQVRADERRDVLRAIPAEFRFVSYEPALGPVDWTGFEFIDQLICGGEAIEGAEAIARPMHPLWARAAEDWCATNDVSFFFKQWGDWLPQGQEMGRDRSAVAKGEHVFPDGQRTFRVGKEAAGRLLDGAIYDQLPVPF